MLKATLKAIGEAAANVFTLWDLTVLALATWAALISSVVVLMGLCHG
jgi:hypothetical protein